MQVILTRAEKRKLGKFITTVVGWAKVSFMIAILVVLLYLCGYNECRYDIEATVVDISGYTYTVEDIAGYEWQFESETLYPVGTKVELKMHHAYTDTRVDDTIMKVNHLK